MIKTVADFYELSKRLDQRQWVILIDYLLQKKLIRMADEKTVLNRYFLEKNKERVQQLIKQIEKVKT